MTKRRAVVFVLPLMLAGCFHSYGKHNEMFSQTVPGTKFKSLSVIAGTDDQSDLRITLQVRQRLAAQGFAIVQRPGTWGTESEALRAICGTAPADSTGAPPVPVDGVVVVAWNEVALHDCESSHMVYQNQGGYGGIDLMVQGLLKYLHGQSGARPGA
jgi:hypothetical protein